MYQLFIDGIKLDGTDRSTVKAYGVQDLHLEIKNIIWLNLQSEGFGGIAPKLAHMSHTRITMFTSTVLSAGLL